MRLGLVPLFAVLSACSSTAPQTVEPPDVPSIDTAEVADPNDGIPPDTGPEPFVETGPGLGLDYAAEPGGVAPRYEPNADDWLAVGWPSDLRRAADGSVDLSRFPDIGSSLLAEYLVLGGEVLDGFGRNGSAYLQLDGPLDVAALPGADASRDSLSPIQLVNVTVGSPDYGRLWPLTFRFYADGTDLFYRPNTLAARAVSGFPLTEGETHCLVLTRGVRDVAGALLQAASGFEDALHEAPELAPLLGWLSDSPLHSTDLATATCFTTQNAMADLRAVVSFLDSEPLPEVALLTEPRVHNEWHGIYLAPNFQAGDKPYDSGGDIQLDSQGQPVVQDVEEIRFMLLIPRGQPAPAQGWPTVVYAHGTGGDYESCRGVAGDLAVVGLATACIDQPLHGSRGPAGIEAPLDYTQLVTSSFNFLNPRAGRSNFRQSAIDSMILGRLVAGGAFDRDASQTLSGQALAFDPDNVSFFGHSHGGLSGALLLGVDTVFRGGVLSGAGGGLLHTILLRKDPLDIAELVRAVLLVAAEDFDAFHPAMSVVQMLVDATDPINYAPAWTGEGGRHVYVTEGTADHASPALSTDQMTAAAGLPLVAPIAKSSPAHSLRGLVPLDKPLAANLPGGLTGAVEQWQDGSHWIAFGSFEAFATWRTFLQTLMLGAPEVGTSDLGVQAVAPVGPGDTCADAGILPGDTDAVEVRGSTAQFDDDYADCSTGAGAGFRDAVFTFTPELAGAYRFRLGVPSKAEPEDPPTGPDRLYVTRDCDSEQACVGTTQDGQLWADLEAGETVFVIIDGSTAAHVGSFSVAIIRGCAIESCGARACGSAGCTDCGTCPGGEICTDTGQCIPGPTGDTCLEPLEVGAVPFVATGDTLDALGDYQYAAGQCAGYGGAFGGASNDVAWRWDVPAPAVYEIRLDADYDANLYVVSDCGDIANSCIGAQRRGAGGERLLLPLEGDQTLFVIVDGAGNVSNRRGHYTLRVGECVPDCGEKTCGDDGCGGTCGPCGDAERCVEDQRCDPIPYLCVPTGVCEAIAPGDTCGQALPLGELPAQAAGTTLDLVDDTLATSACPGLGSSVGGGAPDMAYALTAPEDGIYRFEVEADWDSALYVASACPASIGATCLAGRDNEKSGEVVYVTLSQGDAVFAIVDGFESGGFESVQSGEYVLKVAACVPACDGKVCGNNGCGGTCGSCTSVQACSGGQCVARPEDACESAPDVGKVPWTQKISYGNYTPGALTLCAAAPGGADAWYRLATAGDWQVELTGSGVLEVLQACGGGCLGSAGPVLVSLADGEAAWIRAAGTGSGTLKVTAYCAPSCEEAACGDDGCGGSCGGCTAPLDRCVEGQCTDPNKVSGNACAAPRVIDGTLSQLPFEVESDTSALDNRLLLTESRCPGWQAKGAASPDEVWEFAPEADGRYQIEVHADFEAVLWATDACTAAPTCRAIDDGHASDRLELDLTAGAAVWLVVDGATNDAPSLGTYRLTISAVSE